MKGKRAGPSAGTALGRVAKLNLQFFIRARAQERDGSMLHLRGDVMIETESAVLRADSADVDIDAHEIRPTGNVLVKLK